MPFLDHLEELRWRLLKSVISVFVMMFICFYFSDQFLDFLLYPGKQIDPPVSLQVLKIQTIFIIKLEIALVAGIILSLPVIFYQFWLFLAPGLLAKERRFIPVIVFASVLCFFLWWCFRIFYYHPVCFRIFSGPGADRYSK